MRTSALILALAACGGSSSSVKDAAGQIDSAKQIDAKVADASPDAASDVTMNLTGGANALMWDGASSTLYFTDNNNVKMMKWTQAGGVADFATLPAESAGVSLGDITKQSDGSFLITNFGFGTQGTLISVSADGQTTANLTGADATRKRIGMSADSNHVLYTSYFTGSGANPVGGVATATIAAGVITETEVATTSGANAFKKIVGLVATPTAVYASDQSNKVIYQIAVPGYAVTNLATVTTADLLYVMPNGDLLTGGASTIERVTPTGTVSTLANTGFDTVRGMAYDPVAHHLFVIDHSSTAGTPDKLHIQTLAN